MKVWIVSTGVDFEGESPVAVFDSLKKAQAAVDDLKTERKKGHAYYRVFYDYETYQEYEVQ